MGIGQLRFQVMREVLAKDREAQEAQSAVQATTRELAKDGRINRRQYIDVDLSVGVQSVRHKLKRVPVGWSVVDITGAAAKFYRDSWDAKTITFSVIDAGTVRLEVW